MLRHIQHFLKYWLLADINQTKLQDTYTTGLRLHSDMNDAGVSLNIHSFIHSDMNEMSLCIVCFQIWTCSQLMGGILRF